MKIIENAAQGQIDFSLHRPKRPLLVANEELALYLKQPKLLKNNASLALKAASLAVKLDRVDEALLLLQSIMPTDDNQFLIAKLQAEAFIAKMTGPSNLSALQALKIAEECAPDLLVLADIVAEQGRIYQRLNDIKTATFLFQRALEYDPLHNAAFQRWARVEFHAGRAAVVLARCYDYIRQGFITTRILTELYLSLSMMGRATEAEAIVGFNEFFLSKKLNSPINNGMAMEPFHRALSLELINHPARRYDRNGSASVSSWRIDEPYLQRSRFFPILLEQLHHEILHRLHQLSKNTGHLWLDTRPKRAQIHVWSIFTEQEGFEQWHNHANGWMSGVYYVAVPNSLEGSSEQHGCIEFGPPVLKLGKSTLDFPGTRHRVRPYPGQLLLFPSFVFHRTYPTQRAQEPRLVVAFDVQIMKGS